MLMIKTACWWVHLPATDESRAKWLNLAQLESVQYELDPPAVWIESTGGNYDDFEGVRAIAIIDALEKLAGGKDDE